MPESRRDRAVMVLGLVALLLFAANMISAIQRHFFPDARAERVVTMEIRRPDVRREIVVMPRMEGHRFRFDIHRTAEAEALAQMQARLAEEVVRLSEESARLAQNGHTDAAASLEDVIAQIRLRLDELRARIEAARLEAEILRDHVPGGPAGVSDAKVSVDAVPLAEVATEPVVVTVEGNSARKIELVVAGTGSRK